MIAFPLRRWVEVKHKWWMEGGRDLDLLRAFCLTWATNQFVWWASDKHCCVSIGFEFREPDGGARPIPGEMLIYPSQMSSLATNLDGYASILNWELTYVLACR